MLRQPVSVPAVLEDFLEARRVGDVEAAAACCTEGIIMRGPLGQFKGIDSVSEKAFTKPSQPLGRVLRGLHCAQA
jgi:ketosteroid isomerase-like protein